MDGAPTDRPLVDPVPSSALPTLPPAPSRHPETGEWPPEGERWMYGVVMDVDRQPVKGMCIDLQDRDDASHLRRIEARTDAHGRWAVETDPRRVRIEAWDCTRAGRFGTSWNALEPPERERNFILPPAGVIEGRVVDKAGRPVKGLCVSAHDGIAEGEASFRVVRTAETNQAGEFRLPGLGRARSETHYVSAGHCDDRRFVPVFGGVLSEQRGNLRWVRHDVTGEEETVEVTYDETVSGVEIVVERCPSSGEACVPRATKP